MGCDTQVGMARSESNPPLCWVTAGLTLVFMLRRGREYKLPGRLGSGMIFCWLVGIWELRQLEQALRYVPSPTASPPPSRTLRHKQMEGLPSQVPHCRADPALPSSGSVLQQQATFHLGRKFFWPKARSYFKQTYVFERKPNSVSQTPLIVQAVPSSRSGHFTSMPEEPAGQEHPAPFPSPMLQLWPQQAWPGL